MQDYAKNKVYFLFSKELSGVEEASARRNYFDLMFSVTARELGCRLEDLGVTQVFSAGRAPSAPFMYPSISKDIVKNLLSDFDYSDDYSDIGSYEALSDQIAMDAFSHMKSGLQQELSSYNMSRPAMENAPGKIYMPCGLKAAVDLEIDALLESGGWLARCKRCGRYYVKDSEYTEDYCSLPGKGRTCLEIYEAEHPRTRVTPEMERECREIMDEMYERVTTGTLSLKEYEGWRLYLEAMKGKVNNGEIQPDDLNAFIAYSRSMDISRSNPVVEVRKPEPEHHERVVKPFVPERISRSDIGKLPEPEEEPVAVQEPPQRREGFFTSPSVERQKSQGRAVSHIIRADRPRVEPQPYQMPLSENPPERGFSAFSERPEPARREVAESAPERGFSAFSERPEPARREVAESAPEQGFTPFEATAETIEEPVKEPVVESTLEPVPEAPKPVPRVIRKNAAAISAYGRMASTAVRADSAFETVSRPEPVEPAPEPAAEPVKEEAAQPVDPFWEIGSIFDVLERSENDMSREQRRAEPAPEPAPEPEHIPEHETENPEPKHSTKKRKSTANPYQEPHEVPSGIWTEDRHLYDDQPTTTHEELNMLKDKKRRSSKTQRLFDAIMKEPDDNPNFRKR